jgi:serine/threonine protein kinase/tetratricopeptide (TPR) repeat protein
VQIEQAPDIIGDRYILHDEIGSGGMGTVYRATDRLTGQTVALKRVHHQPDQLAFNSRAGKSEPGLALAHEFQTLSVLRHPNIISVIDYGFDIESRPYFTMSLLESGRDIREVAQERDFPGKIDLLIQTLQALDYLHRRNVVHRDLKPGNVLINQSGQVKLLDFGLSLVDVQTSKNLVDTFAGTFGYTAPEVFIGDPVGRATDLYALGVIAYEIFAGKHPFDLNNLGTLVMDIINKPIDVYAIGLDKPIADVLHQLVAKNREDRYREAQQVIRDFCIATQQPIPEESSAIRESFLQSAQLVGRDDELTQLAEALNAMRDGNGSAWLMGGESGVGKSRLMRELSTYAMVGGMLVLVGYGVREGGMPYQLWHDVLRRLILSTRITDQEASILKEIVPDIDALLDRPIISMPSSDARSQQQRLVRVIVDVFKRQQRPVLLLLEDLQWTPPGNIQILTEVLPVVNDLPLMIIASFRDDEQPNMPSDLSAMRFIKLERLTKAAIADLSSAMLGEVGRQEQIVDLLQRETEGNAFFLIEVVRALASEAGGLAEIGTYTLPEHVFAEGVQSLVQWRLERVPDWTRGLLRLAATAGRRVDLAVLQRCMPADPGFSQEEWLAACGDAAILEIRDEHWQFTHDKLREGLLNQTDDEERVALHRQVAGAIETIYGSNLARYSADLAVHYRHAGMVERERYFALVASEQALLRYATYDAIAFLQRALEITAADDVAGNYDVLMIWEQVHDLQGARDSQSAHLATLVELAETLDDDRKRVEVALRQAQFGDVTGDYQSVVEAATKSVGLSIKLGAIEQEAEARYWWGQALYRQGDYAEARSLLEKAQTQAHAAYLPSVAANSLRSLGAIATRLGDYAAAQTYFERSRDISHRLNDRRGESWAFGNLGFVRQMQGDYEGARVYFEECLAISREIGDRWAESNTLCNLGIIGYEQGAFDSARAMLESCLQISHETDDRQNEGEAFYNLGNIYRALGVFPKAHDAYEMALHVFSDIGNRLFEGWTLASMGLLYHNINQDEIAAHYIGQALDLARKLDSSPLEGYALLKQGHTLLKRDRFDEALSAYRQSLELRQEMRQHFLVVEPLAGLARTLHARGDNAAALQHVNTILDQLRAENLDGLEEPFDVYLVCYRILGSTEPSRATAVLKTAYRLLQERAMQINDETQRGSFLNNVATHQALIAAWRATHQDS